MTKLLKALFFASMIAGSLPAQAEDQPVLGMTAMVGEDEAAERARIEKAEFIGKITCNLIGCKPQIDEIGFSSSLSGRTQFVSWRKNSLKQIRKMNAESEAMASICYGLEDHLSECAAAEEQARRAGTASGQAVAIKKLFEVAIAQQKPEVAQKAKVRVMTMAMKRLSQDAAVQAFVDAGEKMVVASAK